MCLECLYDDVTHQTPALFSPAMVDDSDDVSASVQPLSKRNSVLVLCVEKSHGMRTLWSKMPEVTQTDIVCAMTMKEIRLQEVLAFCSAVLKAVLCAVWPIIE